MNDYRGKRIDNGEWVKGSLVEVVDGFWILPKDQYLTDLAYFFRDNEKHAEAFEVRPASVGQSTGKKDKNDVEVYRGDEVLGDPDVGTAFVEWNQFVAAFGITKKGVFLYPSSFTYSWQDLEVIGNIYDNPELLEVE